MKEESCLGGTRLCRQFLRFHALPRISYRFDSPRRMGLPPIGVVLFDDLCPERSGEVPAGAHPRPHLFPWRHTPRHRGSITGRLHCPSVLGRHSGSFRPRPVGCVCRHAKSTTGRFMERSGINHVHGLVGLVPGENAVETLDPTSLRHDANQGDTDVNQRMWTISPKPGSVSTIVRSYKSAVTRWARRNGCPDFAWQPRFYDRIVRNRAALKRIRRYITDNPTHWHRDRQHVR